MDNPYHLLAPQVIIACVALAVILLDLVVKRKALLAGLSVVGLLALRVRIHRLRETTFLRKLWEFHQRQLARPDSQVVLFGQARYHRFRLVPFPPDWDTEQQVPGGSEKDIGRDQL